MNPSTIFTALFHPAHPILPSCAMAVAVITSMTPTTAFCTEEDIVKFHENFTEGADRWTTTDADAWKINECDQQGKVFSLVKKRSDYAPPHRSPLNIALLDDVILGSFTLTLKMRTSEPYYNHRDLCLFFAHQGPDKFHYVHLGEETDPHANQIFIVNEAPRVKISEKTTEGTKWRDGHWHSVKLERNVETGRIAVYFDDMETPIMEATDKTFTWGRIGIGSFDDTGCFADIRIEGNKAQPAEATP